MRKLILLLCLPLVAQEPKDTAIVYLQAHAKAVEAAAAIDKLNAEYIQRFTALRDASTQRQAEESVALQELSKHLGCTNGVDVEKLACK